MPRIEKLFLLGHDKIGIMEDGSIQKRAKGWMWVLETDVGNLKTVMCIDGVD